MVSKVFFIDGGDYTGNSEKCFRLISEKFSGSVALKTHFGEEKNTTHINPEWITSLGTYFKNPVFVDCNVLYRGMRTRRTDHVELAKRHGFGFLPIDILDGEMGEEELEVPVNLGTTKNARLGAGIERYGNWVALTHFKGHIATGFGGCIKNVGMGLGSRAGKLDMHSVVSPVVRQEKCVACGKCVADCPADAISINGKAKIDSDKCIGCAHCIAVCPNSAIDIPWEMLDNTNNALMERICEYAYAALRGRKWWFMNYMVNITYDCDCMNIAQKPFMKDVGIVLSEDIVAADQASYDLISEVVGYDPFKKKFGVDGAYQLEYGEKIGLGSRKYVLERL
ncbi:MAG: DUF362 domain-containing protein [Candidatus Altiarchaeota archaeon]|nr:DUF362 domain-containing protein [Candidatus Altiarchaeota archaeon]